MRFMRDKIQESQLFATHCQNGVQPSSMGHPLLSMWNIHPLAFSIPKTFALTVSALPSLLSSHGVLAASAGRNQPDVLQNCPPKRL
jgi:hypothetical protein